MMHDLILNYTFKRHPYPEEPTSKNERWAAIVLGVHSQSTGFRKEILNIEWNIDDLINWFIENKSALTTEELPIKLNDSNTSIAKALFNFYESIDESNIDDNEVLIDEVYDYRQRHGLKFALRGVDIRDIYIGILGDSATISYFGENEEWEYPIDLNKFYSNLISD